MVYYIRFLKTPKIFQKKKGLQIKAAVAVTTDLGDAFYPEKLQLGYEILSGDERVVKKDNNGLHCPENTLCLRLDIPIERSHCLKPLRMHLFQKAAAGVGGTYFGDIPFIVDVWSDYFIFSNHDTTSWRVERQLVLGNAAPLKIWEDMGDSIARHIWDSGTAFAAHISGTSHGESTLITNLLGILHGKSRRLNVLELGSGCGVLGIACAQLIPHSKVVLTDLPEAMDLLECNMSQARLAKGSELSMTTLNWELELPQLVKNQEWDLVLVADCTYNTDTLPALVRTLSALISLCPKAKIVVFTKVRHSSEAVFFDLMKEAAFVVADQQKIKLPDAYRSLVGLPIETVDIYTFHDKNHLPGEP